jgi:hypothetical protein
MGVELDEMFWQKMCELRVAVPAVVVSFSATTQNVVVQPAVQENILRNGVPTPEDLPQLSNVPLGILRLGGFCITFPVNVGDEGLVVFADMSIDSWWQSGGTANNQVERRRHDLTDGLFFPMFQSQPRSLTNYSTSALQVKSDDGTTVITVSEGQIILTPDSGTTQIVLTPGSATVTPDSGTTQIVLTPGAAHINATAITLNGDVTVTGQLTVDDTIVGHDDATISGIGYLGHEHSGVTTGGGTSGPPV